MVNVSIGLTPKTSNKSTFLISGFSEAHIPFISLVAKSVVGGYEHPVKFDKSIVNDSVLLSGEIGALSTIRTFGYESFFEYLKTNSAWSASKQTPIFELAVLFMGDIVASKEIALFYQSYKLENDGLGSRELQLANGDLIGLGNEDVKKSLALCSIEFEVIEPNTIVQLGINKSRFATWTLDKSKNICCAFSPVW